MYCKKKPDLTIGLVLVEAAGLQNTSLSCPRADIISMRSVAPGEFVKPATRILTRTTATNKKGLPFGSPSLFGGGGGDRTRVRKYSAIGSTCLFRF